jgi:hypothetical protein
MPESCYVLVFQDRRFLPCWPGQPPRIVGVAMIRTTATAAACLVARGCCGSYLMRPAAGQNPSSLGIIWSSAGIAAPLGTPSGLGSRPTFCREGRADSKAPGSRAYRRQDSRRVPKRTCGTALGPAPRRQAVIWHSRHAAFGHTAFPDEAEKTLAPHRIASPPGGRHTLMLAAAAPIRRARGQVSAARCRWSGRESHAMAVHDHRLYRAPEDGPSKAP